MQKPVNFVISRTTSAHWKTASAFLFFALFMGLPSLSAQTSIEGQWKTEEGAIIEIFEEDDIFYGKVVKAADAEANQKLAATGKEIMVLRDFTKKSDKKYCCGKVIALKQQRTLSGNLTLRDDNTLSVKVKAGVMSKTKTWTRISTQ